MMVNGNSPPTSQRTAFFVLFAGNLYQGTERGIHSLGVGKVLRNIGRKCNEVRALGVSLGVLAPHALAEARTRPACPGRALSLAAFFMVLPAT